MVKRSSLGSCKTLLIDAAKALAMLDRISTRDDTESLTLAAARATELYDQLLRRGTAAHLPEYEAELFQSLMDRLKAQIRFLRSAR